MKAILGSPATGHKFQTEIDYSAGAGSNLNFSRYYNSQGNYFTSQYFTPGWRHNFSLTMDTVPIQATKSYAAGGETSSVYATPEAACLNGFAEIKDSVWGGELVDASAEYLGGNLCRIFKAQQTLSWFIIGGGIEIGTFPAKGIHTIVRPNGMLHVFQKDNSQWVDRFNPNVKLELSGDNWIFTDADNTRETYNASGQLIAVTLPSGRSQMLVYDLPAGAGGDGNPTTLDRVTDAAGRSLFFVYTDNAGKPRLSTVNTPDGDITYSYDTRGNLATITYPDGSHKTYHYQDTRYPHHLTGITDENNIRFASWAYDATGQVYFSGHASGTDQVFLQYNRDGTTTVTGALGDTRTYHFSLQNGRRVVSQITGDQCTTCGNGFMQSRTYDANGNLSGYTDWNGGRVELIYNDRGLITQRTDAAGTPEEKVILTEWHPDFNLPTRITEAERITDISYDTSGRVIGRTLTDPATGKTRTTTYTYHPLGNNGAGLLASIDGPRTDVSDITTYEYDAQGNLIKITNPLGQATHITVCDASGRPTVIADPNGVETRLQYDPRGRLIQRTVAGQTTQFSYDPAGNLTRITLPGGAYLAYEYDPARRLIAVEDNAGNRMEYTLDAQGNRTRVKILDGQGNLAYRQSQAFNRLGRLIRSLGAQNQIREYSYDGNGNVIAETDPLNRTTLHSFDALDRLIQTEDPAGGVTQYQYDPAGHLRQVTDPRNQATIYTYDGLGNLLSVQSPDTGVTTYSYDTAGNRLSQTDARGVTVHYQYDALDRLTRVLYPNGDQVDYIYDQGAFGIGRLTRMSDPEGVTDYRYDANGNPIRIIRRQQGRNYVTGYAYDGAGRLVRMTYPSSRVVNYQRDGQGKIIKITTQAQPGAALETLADNIIYLPFGPLTGLTYGNGLTLHQSFDAAYRLQSQHAGAVWQRDYTADAQGNITVILNGVRNIQDHYGYDLLDRLVSNDGDFGLAQYSYDSVGNRTQLQVNTNLATYFIAPSSNRLQQISDPDPVILKYDASGNRIQKGSLSYIYNDAGQLTEVLGAGQTVTYRYNGQGERVTKQVGASQRLFHYDLSGRLLAESNGQGQLLAEYIYLEDRPIAVFQPAPRLAAPIALDGNPQDWSNGDLLHQENGYQLYGRLQNGVFYLALKSASLTMGPGTTIWLDTDFDSGTGYQVWGLAVGAEYNVNVYSDNTLHLYTGAAAETWQRSLDYGRSADGKFLEWAVPAGALGSASGFRVHLDINDSVFLPSDYSQPGYPVPAQNPIVLDGDLSDWQATLPLTIENGIWVYGKILGDQVYLALASETTTLGPNTTLWLNTDQDTATGHQIWGFAVGAEYNINVYRDNTPHLYTGAAAETWRQALDYGRSPDGKILEIAIPRGALGNPGQTLDLWLDVNDSIFLPSDYSQPGYPLQIQSSESLDAARVYYVLSDHLGTPRVLIDSQGQAVWQWRATPFGASAPDEDPDGDGNQVVFNLRFPGQYYDAETRLHYNYFRYYDPGTGRYLTSDPIGLDGGLNTYLYANANPVRYIDPTGEIPLILPAIPPALAALGKAAAFVGSAGLAGLALSEIFDGDDDATDDASDDPEQCEDDQDDNCEALYQSILQTCAGLTGRKRFRCFEAARIARDQCYQERKR